MNRRNGVAFALGLIIGIAATGGYFAMNPVTKTEIQTQYQTIKEPVSDEGIVFTVTHGPDAPPDWGYPVTVEFQRPDDGNWTTRYMAVAFRDDPFVVDLEESKRYRIKLTPPSGESRVLGSYHPTGEEPNVELLVGACCHDDFSGS